MWLSCVQTSQEAKLNHSHLCYQDTPKRISFPSDCKILGLTAHRYGVFAVVSSGNILRVGRVDMLTGKVSDGGKFPDTQAQHFAKQQSCTLHKLVCPRIVAQWSRIVAQWSRIVAQWAYIVAQWPCIVAQWSCIVAQWPCIVAQWPLIVFSYAPFTSIRTCTKHDKPESYVHLLLTLCCCKDVLLLSIPHRVCADILHASSAATL